MSENVPPPLRLRYLNPWFLVDDAVWRGLKGLVLLEEGYHWRVVFEIKKFHLLPVYSLCFMPVVKDMSSQLPAAMLFHHVGLSSLCHHNPNKPCLLQVVLVMVLYHGNRKVTNTLNFLVAVTKYPTIVILGGLISAYSLRVWSSMLGRCGNRSMSPLVTLHP